jgi:hypothetical protein
MLHASSNTPKCDEGSIKQRLKMINMNRALKLLRSLASDNWQVTDSYCKVSQALVSLTQFTILHQIHVNRGGWLTVLLLTHVQESLGSSIG